MKRRGLIALAVAVTAVLLLRVTRPPLKDGISFSKAVFDEDGRLLRLTLSQDEKYRLWTPLAQISPKLVEATLQEEDRYFRFHFGFNPVALSKAAFRTYGGGDKRRGASTVTMQLVRLREKMVTKTIFGKLRQLASAIGLEIRYPKNEILEAYLNLAPYGLNIEGVGAAALIYFGRPVERLSLAEAVTLVALPQSPSIRSPRGGNATADLVRKRILDEWVRLHPKDQVSAPHELAMKMGLPKDLPFYAPHFVDDVMTTPTENTYLLTTLNLPLQKLMERQVKRYVDGKSELGIRNASVIVVDWQTMQVKAVVGSANFFDAAIEGQVNGTKALRSPGSTMKPLIYALAMEQGLIHPRTMLKDSPLHFGTENPENSDKEFLGPVLARNALNLSRNIPALWLAGKLHDPDLYDLLKNANVTFPHDREYYGLALTLGGAELTMEDLTRLYAMLANRGKLQSLRKLRTEILPPAKRVLTEQSSFLVMEMMRDNPRPDTQGFVKFATEHLPVAWKTGTSNGFRDAWTMGVVGKYVIGVWVGNFDGAPNAAFVGRDAAAPLFFRAVDALGGQNKSVFEDEPLPEGIVQTKVCAISGMLPGPACQKIATTHFIPGISPIKTCDIHREVRISNRSGMRLCAESAEESHDEVFEFWTSDLLRLFRLAGVPRRTPPPLDPKCHLTGNMAGVAPSITSPLRTMSYIVRTKTLKSDLIPFTATTDADVKKLFWFVNEQFIGEVGQHNPLFWNPQPGRFIVRVVDEQGRSDAREVHITAKD